MRLDNDKLMLTLNDYLITFLILIIYSNFRYSILLLNSDLHHFFFPLGFLPPVLPPDRLKVVTVRENYHCYGMEL